MDKKGIGTGAVVEGLSFEGKSVGFSRTPPIKNESQKREQLLHQRRFGEDGEGENPFQAE